MVAGIVVLAVVLASGGASKAKPGARPPAGAVRTLVSIRARAAGTLPAAVADGAGAGSLLLGGLDARGSSVAAVVSLAAGGARRHGVLPGPQHDASAAVLDGAVYVFGG